MTAVLIVEDDMDIAHLIRVHLEDLSLTVEHAPTGAQALQLASQHEFSLVLLDLMLPDMSGLDICRQLRTQHPTQAIVMLTSRSSETDRVVGLELGADDYMTKPFSIRELQARVRTQLRRAALYLQPIHSQSGSPNMQPNLSNEQRAQSGVLTNGRSPKLMENGNTQQMIAEPGPSQTMSAVAQATPAQATPALCQGALVIDQRSRQVTFAKTPIDLTATEFELLVFLAEHPNHVFSREQLLNSVWGYQHSGYEHTVNSHINRLRKKLEHDPAKPDIVQTVWGVGYKFNPDGCLR